MKDGFRIYDTHAHLGTARHSGRTQDASSLLKAMDAAQIDRALLLPFPVVEDPQSQHDLIAAAVRAHPDRFSGAICINPFLDPAFFTQEVRRCAEDHGFRVLKLQPQYQALNPISRRGDFFYEAADRHRLTIVVHTGTGVPFALPSLYIMPARRFPNVNFILGHAGGSVYMLETIVAASVCPNVYIEVSSLMPHHVAEILAHIPASRLMAGSDLPESLVTEMHKVLTLDIPDDAKRDILWNTPRRVLDGMTNPD